jgi:hypothetical protein
MLSEQGIAVTGSTVRVCANTHVTKHEDIVSRFLGCDGRFILGLTGFEQLPICL